MVALIITNLTEEVYIEDEEPNRKSKIFKFRSRKTNLNLNISKKSELGALTNRSSKSHIESSRKRKHKSQMVTSSTKKNSSTRSPKIRVKS